MSELRIITNNHKRDILYWHDLTPKERKEFDWIVDSDTVTAEECEFFRYRGWVYCLSEIMRVEHDADFTGWDGYISDSFFSGILVKYPREDWGGIDTDHVICGLYLA